MIYCAPNIVMLFNKDSCFSYDDLLVLAKAYNDWCIANNKKNLINLSLFTNKQKILKALQHVLYNKCKLEYCWLNLDFINFIKNKSIITKLKHFTFKPLSPKSKYTWLSTTDIDNVMIQYNIVFHNFFYLGTFPCDFYKNITFSKYKLKKYNYIAAIINLDKNNQKGSHWVSLFIDNINCSIEYFDSLANSPNNCIQKYLDYLKKIFPNYIYLQNTIQHQYKNSECGVYSIYFILNRLSGKSFHHLIHTIIKDDKMNQFRNFIFRPRLK